MSTTFTPSSTRPCENASKSASEDLRQSLATTTFEPPPKPQNRAYARAMR